MRHSNRPALRDLPSKQWKHAAIAAQHITETHRHEFCIIMFVKSLDNHLADPLTRSHDIRGVHRLVCGDHNKPLHAAHRRRLRSLESTEHIVFHSLSRTILHQRHMLMRRRMVHDVRPILGEDIIHPVGVAHRSDQYHKIQFRILRFQFLLNIIDRILINIHDHELLRLMRRNLPA